MAIVWIDNDACMGAGTCEQISPHVFHGLRDGTWTVKEDASYYGLSVVFDGREGHGHGPLGCEGRARVPDQLLDSVIEAAGECPGECIFVEA